MNIRKIVTTFATVLCFSVFMVILVSCDNDRGMMHGSLSMGNDHWNWGQILFSLGIGVVLGFLLCWVISKRK